LDLFRNTLQIPQETGLATIAQTVSVESVKRSTIENDVMDPEQKLEEWRTLARVLDRLFFIVYITICPIVTLVYFGILQNQH
jgi:hypothetical protein